jgi:hypothetical protein
MAKDILYINDGPAINAAWTNHIVISGDSVNWDAINKTALSAGKHAINLNTSVSNSYPERNKEEGFVIVIKRSDNEGSILKFNPEKVLNQPTWSVSAPGGTATSLLSGAQAALADILTWLA